MGLTIVIDINGQRPESAVPFARFLEVSSVNQVLLSGSAGGLPVWVERLHRHYSHASSLVKVIGTAARKDESIIMLAAEAMVTALSEPDRLKDKWLIISRREGFGGLVDRLRTLGVQEAAWAPMVTPDLLASMMPGGAQVGDAIRSIVQGMMDKQPGEPLLIGAIANVVTDLLPDLRSAEYREQLFGSRRFKAICLAIGLNVKGDYVHPSNS